MKSITYALLAQAAEMAALLHCQFQAGAMFKISISQTPGKRTLLVEGKLIPPWTGELERVWRDANKDLDGRKLAIDLSDVTTINREGEDTLFDLMKEGAKFTCGGVLTKHVVKTLARRSHSKFRDVLLTISEKSES